MPELVKFAYSTYLNNHIIILLVNECTYVWNYIETRVHWKLSISLNFWDNEFK